MRTQPCASLRKTRMEEEDDLAYHDEDERFSEDEDAFGEERRAPRGKRRAADPMV